MEQTRINTKETSLPTIDELIRENLILLENSAKSMTKKTTYTKLVNPYSSRCTKTIENRMMLTDQHPKFMTPYDRSQRSPPVKLEKPQEITPNWLSPDKVIQLCADKLTPYEHNEILNYPHVYFIGAKASHQKKTGTFSMDCNFGYDDSEGSYLHVINDHIAYRYEILKPMGEGAFGQVLKVYDHKTKQYAAIKIVKNGKRFLQQAKKEVIILEHLLKEDPDNSKNMVHILNKFVFRGHACIVFELLSINIYDLIKKNKFVGFTVKLVRNFAHSILIALNMLHKNRIVHADLKPENILLKQAGKSGIKVIDFGASSFEGSTLYTYIQSRFYRAPEVILGSGYGSPIDMWSFGCIVAELLLGYPILPGEDEDDQIALTIELLGMPPESLVQRSRRANRFFSKEEGYPLYCTLRNQNDIDVLEGGKSRRGVLRGPPGSKKLKTVLSQVIQDKEELIFVTDFIIRCLQWDPMCRMTPRMALSHCWLKKKEKA